LKAALELSRVSTSFVVALHILARELLRIFQVSREDPPSNLELRTFGMDVEAHYGDEAECNEMERRLNPIG
jgi:hypothetical protein